MRIAVISDIHSNHLALLAVLRDISDKKADFIICLGDLVGYCTFPNEVIGILKERNILCVMGNYDEAVGYERFICGCDYPDPKDAENAAMSLNWTIDNVNDKNKEFLRELPENVQMIINKKKIEFVHGSPRMMNEYLKEDSAAAKEVMDTFTGDILVCAHTHKPYSKYYGKKLLVNSGSVGKSKTGKPDANYIILDVKDEINVEINEVSYDYNTIADAIIEKGLPNEFADMIRTGRA